MKNQIINKLIFIVALIVFIGSLSMVTDAVDKHNSNKAIWAIVIAYLVGTLAGWLAHSEWLAKRKKG